MEQFALSQFLHVAVEAREEGRAFTIKLHFLAIQQRVVGSGLRKELHDQRNGIHQHEKQREHQISHESEGAALLPILEKLVQGERLLQNITPRLRLNDGDALALIQREPTDLGVEVFELEEQCIDLRLQRLADGVLLAHELIRLLLLHLLLEHLDAVFFGFDASRILSGFGIESGIHAIFGGFDLGDERHAIFRHRIQHTTEAGALGTTPGELVFLNAFGTRTEADDTATLAVHLPLKLRLPMIELSGDLLVIGAQLGHLDIENFELRFQRRGSFRHLRLAFGLGLLFIFGQRLLNRLAILIEELGAETSIPSLTLLGDFALQRGDAGLDSHFLLFRGLASRLDLFLPMLLNDGSHGIFEKQQRERMGDRDAHQRGRHHAQAKLRCLAEEALVSAVSGQQRTVHRENDEGPHQRHRRDDPHIVRQRAQGIGAGDDGKDARHEHRGSKGDVFTPLPSGAGVEVVRRSGGEPEEDTFDAVEEGHGAWGRSCASVRAACLESRRGMNAVSANHSPVPTEREVTEESRTDQIALGYSAPVAAVGAVVAVIAHGPVLLVSECLLISG